MIRLKKPMVQGAAVRRIQEMLDMVGYVSIQTDGKYGRFTAEAVRAFQAHNKLNIDGIVGPATMNALRRRAGENEAQSIKSVNRWNLVDTTGMHAPPRNLHKKRPERPLSKIDSIVLHQTGCDMPNTPKGWGRVNAHYGIMQDGTPIKMNPIEMNIWHAQGLSLRSIGIEIEGNYVGNEMDARTLWAGGGGPHSLNAKMVFAAATILDDILRQEVVPAHVYAHRQSSRMRRACPGGEIWRRIGGHLRTVLECPKSDLTETFGRDSRPIPVVWDKNGIGNY